MLDIEQFNAFMGGALSGCDWIVGSEGKWLVINLSKRFVIGMDFLNNCIHVKKLHLSLFEPIAAKYLCERKDLFDIQQHEERLKSLHFDDEPFFVPTIFEPRPSIFELEDRLLGLVSARNELTKVENDLWYLSSLNSFLSESCSFMLSSATLLDRYHLAKISWSDQSLHALWWQHPKEIIWMINLDLSLPSMKDYHPKLIRFVSSVLFEATEWLIKKGISRQGYALIFSFLYGDAVSAVLSSQLTLCAQSFFDQNKDVRRCLPATAPLDQSPNL